MQAVLLSAIAKLFVSMYSTKIRGGYLRFQAQYLRRIRIPLWESVPQDLREELHRAGSSRDLGACNAVAFKLYRLSSNEVAALQS